MTVIRQFPNNSGCSVCNSLVDLPHSDHDDCRLALAKEMDLILRRAKDITQKRQALTQARLRELAESQPRPKAAPKRRRPRLVSRKR